VRMLVDMLLPTFLPLYCSESLAVAAVKAVIKNLGILEEKDCTYVCTHSAKIIAWLREHDNEDLRPTNTEQPWVLNPTFSPQDRNGESEEPSHVTQRPRVDGEKHVTELTAFLPPRYYNNKDLAKQAAKHVTAEFGYFLSVEKYLVELCKTDHKPTALHDIYSEVSNDNAPQASRVDVEKNLTEFLCVFYETGN